MCIAESRGKTLGVYELEMVEELPKWRWEDIIRHDLKLCSWKHEDAEEQNRWNNLIYPPPVRYQAQISVTQVGKYFFQCHHNCS